ncbi:cupin domain-containing protein [Clostridiaceae bacterium OttesenSCG-928-D20]|nr:cupin domain-containing protein [Clostridiaceae bacterium OttesenSCG-928-D20]
MGKMGINDDIGRRISELRDICGFTMKEMAEATGVDMKTYIGYERSGEDIPIGVIFRIANKCNIDFTEIITGNSAKLDTYQVVRRGEGMEISRNEDYTYRDQAFLFGSKIMAPTMVTLRSKTPELNTHEGHEFDYIVSGSMHLFVEDKEMILNAGDTVYLNASIPHGFCVEGDEPCVFLAVIAE